MCRGIRAPPVVARASGAPGAARLRADGNPRLRRLPRPPVRHAARISHIDGGFFPAHRADIEHLLRNEAERARDVNPISQIVEWRDLNGGGLLIGTSTEHLAQRLGHALEKAYDGKVHYGFSHENKMAHVWWRR
jgi:hypothetical protein